MFKFKRFCIFQENAAMKVCTDSCLFGAIANADQPKNGLDIGTGTGLLSLMLAQKYPQLHIDAVEINQSALLDAERNVSESEFKDRISLIHLPIQEFKSDFTYDIIICNPPFFENHLKSPKDSKNLSHHSEALKNTDLAEASKKHLSSTGSLWVLLPPTQMHSFEKEASSRDLKVHSRYFLRHSKDKPIFRVITEFKFSMPEIHSEQEIIICENDKYSPIFTHLLRDYYQIF